MYNDVILPYGKNSRNSSILIAVGLVLVLILGISQIITLSNANPNNVGVIGNSVSGNQNFMEFSVVGMLIALIALFMLSWTAALVVNL